MIRLIPELVLERAAASPEAPAVIWDDGRVSYADLMDSARRVGAALAGHGGSSVGVLVPPGPDLVAALLGVWLAGACYVPLDPSAPAARMRDIVERSGARVVLTGAGAAVPGGVTGLDVASLPAAGQFRPVATKPHQAAYMIFTSGSTGTPKGVVVEHAGIANRVGWGVRELGLSPTDRVLQKTSLAFDAAQWEIFAPLVRGAPVTFGHPDAGRDPAELIRSIRARQATVVQLVPSMLRLVAARPELAGCASLRMICCGGEQLQAELCQQVTARLPVEIMNTYGPTECSIDVLYARFDPAQRDGPVPIGRPIDNMRCVLLRPDEGTTADPAIRELYASGPGVARGYHGDPARTADRFLPDPSGAPGARMYRTGDLVRARPDGALEFVGRVDAQVKVNGVRIEPGEVEAALEAHPEVVEAAVAAVTDPGGAVRLAAWVVPPSGELIRALPAYLRETLPPAMVPMIVSGVAALPRTVSGKKDRAALPDPDWSAPAGPGGAEARTADERVVLAAWRQVLGVDEIGLDDDFFRLGGHSLMTTTLAASIAEASGIVLEFRELHFTPTVRGQARLLRTAREARPIELLPPDARRPLSPAQERFWVLDRMNPGSREYLQPILVWLPAEVPASVVERALALVMRRHEVLRTGYAMDAAGLAARVEPDVAVPLRVTATAPDLVGKVVAADLAEGFDLARPPLWRATLVRDGGHEQLLMLVCHHIICDGWSARLLEREVTESVAAIRAGRDPRLPSLALGYTDAVAWQRAELTDDALAGHLAYWRDALAGLPALAVPTDRQRSEPRAIDGAAVAVHLADGTAAALLATGRDVAATPHVVFLTLWTILLAHAGGAWDFGVGTPHAGRSRPELHDLIGLFMDVVVVRSGLAPEMSFADALASVDRACREAFTHAAPFEAVVDAVGAPRDQSRTPLFQALFTLVGDDLAGPRVRERDVELLEQAWLVARTDLALTLWPEGDGSYGGALEYASALFDAATATRLADGLRGLAEQFAADPGRAIGAATLGGSPAALPTHQRVILDAVRELLKSDQVGLADDVMESGGNSLLAARLLWTVENAFGVEVSMRAFFDRPTAAGLADEVERLLRVDAGADPNSDGGI